MKLMIVESPAKAKTINKYLGSDYKVLASFGHIRDLPSKNDSVIPEENFAMHWEMDSNSKKRVADIVTALKGADTLILATDPDREGEAIAWHILEVLQQKKALKNKTIQRVIFNSITKNAILEALSKPRNIDQDLVDAYLARRALDYLVGFSLSPILWRKLPGARSAGRVQSVALRLIHDRETEIELFKSEDYWQIFATFLTQAQQSFTAKLVAYNDQKLEKLSINNAQLAEALSSFLNNSSFRVLSREAKPIKRNPYAPFTTSTLQQAASSQLGFSASKTMQIAQKLYEGIDIAGDATGLITYMRTDSVQLGSEAIEKARSLISAQYGAAYLPERPRIYTTKSKNAQEAHEAIRPTDFSKTPAQLKDYLDADYYKLYNLIWQRAVASQMKSAIFERTTIEIEAKAYDKVGILRATGSVQKFDGFLKLYNHNNEELDEDAKIMPEVASDEKLELEEVVSSQHATEPPARYSEASLIKNLEELGIGRPSTYASTLTTLKDRNYINIEQRKLLPQPQGRLVTAFLMNFFSKYVEYDFTAELEDKLDLIAEAKLEWREVLASFWQKFSEAISYAQKLRISNVLDELNIALAPLIFPPKEDGSDPRKCPKCDNGTLSLKNSKFGAFIGCSNYPDCDYTRTFDSNAPNAQVEAPQAETQILGTDAESGEDILLKIGRFGPYIQLGSEKTAKKVSIPPAWRQNPINLQQAEQLLSLPKLLGTHPSTQEPITAAIGRFGPYLLHNGKYTSVANIDLLFTLDLDAAVELIDSKASGSASSRKSAEPIRKLAEHPEGGEINIFNGRFGPYIKWGKLNVKIPSDTRIEAITTEMALALIVEKMNASPSKTKSSSKKKVSGAKTTTTKKSLAKTGGKTKRKLATDKEIEKKPKSAKAKSKKTSDTD